MEQKTLQELKKKIDSASIVSFDLYDTLIFRKHGGPQEVFQLMGCLMHRPYFQKERARMQKKAYRTVNRSYGYPHPTLHEIYQYGSSMDDRQKHACESLERWLEQREAFANHTMRQIFNYALSAGKRLVVTTDMYLEKEEIQKILKACGYGKADGLYLSSELKKTKYDGSMYQYLVMKEKTAPGSILHIGDQKHADADMARRFGIRTFHYTDGDRDFTDSFYEEHANNENIKAEDTKERIFHNRAFWYQTGWQTGGPLYMGLCVWIRKKRKGRKLYCLSRDGYNLMRVLKRFGISDCQYICASRRALLLPAIDRLGERELALLPPYSCGQTIREVLEYLDFTGIREADFIRQGFSGYGDVIRTKGDIAKIKKVYAANEPYILRQCAGERRNLEQYFRAQGLFGSQALFFDSGWNGTSQYLVERVYRLLGIRTDIEFLYAGLKRNGRSAGYLQHSRYHAFLNEHLPPGKLNAVLDGAAVLELFFSSDTSALLRYGNHGPEFEPYETYEPEPAPYGFDEAEPEPYGFDEAPEPYGCNDLESAVYETNNLEPETNGLEAASYKANSVEAATYGKNRHIAWINEGLEDYIIQNSSFIRNQWTAGLERYAVSRVSGLLTRPSPVQAQIIGDLENADSISACCGMKKYIARIPTGLLWRNPFLDIYWERGVYRHPENCRCVKWYVFLRQRAAHWKQKQAGCTEYRKCRH